MRLPKKPKMSQQNKFKETLVHLNLLDRIGPVAIKNILHKIGPENIYQATSKDFIFAGLSEQVASQLCVSLKDKLALEKELEIISRNNVQVVTLLDNDYPAQLKNISSPPPVLYCLGDVTLLNKKNSLAVVGARKATNYGKEFIDNVIAPVSCHRVIVSGGALGIDSWAHQVALAQNQPTIAVLGSGLKKPYPYANKKLFEQIQENGLLVSPFPLLMDPLAGNFPARNRIVAGLAESCVVVQAAAKSGALITAYIALEQGKDVFAVPGQFNDPLSAGCHKLLQDGASLATCIGDFIGEAKQISFINQLENKVDLDIKSLCVKGCTTEYLSHRLAKSVQLVEDELFELQILGKVYQDHAGLWHNSY